MGRRALICLALVAALVLGDAWIGAPRTVADADDPGPVIDTWVPSGDADANDRALHGSYTGFGALATGGEGRPLFTVTSLADNGIGSLRSVLDDVRRLGGGRVAFAIAGAVVLLDEVDVPADTTIDGLTAPSPGITLWGDRLGSGGGVLDIAASNVIVRGLRIRNAANDGIHVAPRGGVPVGRIVVDHCSVTNSGDGGIDVTGADGALVTDVTLSWNYLAANGGPCAKVWCGGGSLVKYGVTRVSAHANVWDKNLRRNPQVDGDGTDDGSLADLRANVVRGYVESGMQLRGGARGNVVGNFFAGDRPLLTSGADVFVAANEGTTAASGVAAAFDVVEPLGQLTQDAVLANAGAPPIDAIDAAYRTTLQTYEDAKNAAIDPTSAITLLGVNGIAGDSAPPLGRATLDAARGALRRARAARTHHDLPSAAVAYESALDLVAKARGLYARPAHDVAAAAALGLSEITVDAAAAGAFAATAVAYAREAGDAGLERRAARRVRRLTG